MKIKVKVLSIVALFALLAFSPKKTGNKDMILVSAVKQTTYGGIAGSPVITRIVIKVKALRNFALVKDSAYAEGKIDAFEINEDSFKVVEKKCLKKGQVITLSFNIVTPTDMGGSNYLDKIPGSPEAKLPVVSASGIVLRYKGGKSRYLDIDPIKTEATIFAP